MKPPLASNLLESYDEELTSVVAELASRAHTLGSKLHPTTAMSAAELVRVMNCYYSNLIEGHTTRPRDIERALSKTFDTDPDRRNLQHEAVAHIRVQRDVDLHFAAGTLAEPASREFIRWLHRTFYEGAPEAFLHVEGDGRSVKMVPGDFRSRPEHDNAVGRHIPPSSTRVDDFMKYFESRYRFEGTPTAARIVSMASAHRPLPPFFPNEAPFGGIDSQSADTADCESSNALRPRRPAKAAPNPRCAVP
ncbi:MAG: hypothetical protein ACKVPX_01475, partial [Myxococcaceae bacterium]